MAFFKPDDETKLYYKLTGDKDKTIVFINGLLMSSGGWISQTDFLKKDFSVLTYDQRCQGASTKFETPFSYTKQVEDLKKLLDHLGIKKAFIAAISYGTAVAKEFAIKYPNYCEKLILLSPVRNLDFKLRCIFEVIRELLKADNFDAFYKFIMGISLTRKAFELFGKDFYTGLNALKKALSTKAVLCLLDSIDYAKDLDNYPDVKVPTLILGAKKDEFLNPDDAITIQKEIKNSTLKMLECGHASVVELSDEINLLIDAFLKKP